MNWDGVGYLIWLLAWASTRVPSATFLRSIGGSYGEVDRAGFSAGGGNEEELDRYDVNGEGVFDRGVLEARAAARAKAAVDLCAMGGSDGEVDRAGFSVGGGTER